MEEEEPCVVPRVRASRWPTSEWTSARQVTATVTGSHRCPWTGPCGHTALFGVCLAARASRTADRERRESRDAAPGTPLSSVVWLWARGLRWPVERHRRGRSAARAAVMREA